MTEPVASPQDPLEITASSGGRHLAILGTAAILVAFITSGISLFIYTTSGDIYLDRSRPGFISDNESPPDYTSPHQTTAFSPDGAITTDAFNDYLQKLNTLITDITAEPDAFSSDALSDEALNIAGSAVD